jgi:hypothetical protein
MAGTSSQRWEAVGALLLTACGSATASDTATGETAPSGGDLCAACGGRELVKLGTLQSPAISEVSGLVPSAVHPGAYYLHNDSGDSPRVFLVDLRGAVLAELELEGAEAVDWEDADGGPCGSERCVYVGDIGDNHEVRGRYTVYRFVEPRAIAGPIQAVAAEALPFVYPDGSHDAETLLVDEAGAVFVVTKVDAGLSGIYAFPAPLTPGREVTLERVGTVTPPYGVPQLTGGAAGPRGVLLRSYSSLFLFPGADVRAALAGKPCMLAVALERQGEAVAWTGQGLGYLTVSEGQAAAIYHTSCEAP